MTLGGAQEPSAPLTYSISDMPPPCNDSYIDPNLLHLKRRLYSTAVPIIIILAILVMLVNGALLVAVRLIRRRSAQDHRHYRNPTLPLTISLAVSDLCTSIAMTFSLVYNSYLFPVLGLPTNACVSLTFEAIRMGGLITSTWHLLALAVSHYLNISHPSTYKEILTPRATRTIIGVMWTLPPVVLLVFMSSTEGQGFRSPYDPCRGHCWRLGFWSTFTFRLTIFFVFVSPFLVMSGLYVKFLHLSYRQDQLIVPTTALKRKRRTFMTTVCIWVTFFLFWIPTCLVFLLTCGTCPLTSDVRPRLVFAVGVLSNLCILLKSLINPIIYAVRIPEIKTALTKQYGWLFRLLNRFGADTHRNTRVDSERLNEYDMLLK